jgi:hypothetical protein
VPDHRDYSLVECRVTGHRHYGLVVRTVAGDEPGYVDESAISDQPAPAADDWPAVGQVLPCVVLGTRQDGRLRLSCRPRDVALARTVADVPAALTAWRAVRDDPGRLGEFLAAADAVPALRWALRQPFGTRDRERAAEIVAAAPAALAGEIQRAG